MWFATIRTPAGPGLIAWSTRGVVALDAFVTGGPPGPSGRMRFLETVVELTGEPPSKASVPDGLRRRVRAAFAGQTGDAPVDLSVFDPLQRLVYRAVMTIPRATVVSYADVARDIGKPRAWRAVGSALRRCPIDFLIPCHRVVHSGGRIAGPTADSIEWKRAMLRRDGVILD